MTWPQAASSAVCLSDLETRGSVGRGAGAAAFGRVAGLLKQRFAGMRSAKGGESLIES